MQLKDIIVCVVSASVDASAIDLGHQIAMDCDAHIACSAIGILQSPVLYTEFGMGAAPVGLLNHENALINRFFAELKEVLDKRFPLIELRPDKTYSPNLESRVATIARYADIAVIRAPSKEESHPYIQLIEAALLGSGRPVLVAPVDWNPGPIGRKIVIGWDASAEAARAMHDALLLTSEDAEVSIVTVDARSGSLDHGDAPGLDIAAHLARHGLKVELRNEGSLGRSTHEVLMQVATDTNADLMVLGGYRHSRLQQSLFGGVTRSMLRDVRLPLLLSH
ncbi:universal stress protein [Hyphomonas sp. BRH_c22]|uniref:universal stress protein n=1 Tax=Hyphomonas sp. BRH_c22 TaxID=1629710 RepID=UPI000AD67462|nr:universal stress protein [Hyphomonas sp. BRH_c22]